MPIEVEGPDGAVHTFPDGTPDDAINQSLSGKYGKGSMASVQQGLPAAGDATPYAGAVMPGTQTVPDYFSDEDRAAKREALIWGGPQAVSKMLSNTPGRTYQIENAKKTSDNQAALAERQRVGGAIVPGIQTLREMVAKIPESDWTQIAGAKNATPAPARSEVPLSWEAWQASKEMTPTQARAAYALGNWSSTTHEDYQRQWGQQNELSHLIEALTEANVAAGGKSVGGSDERMKLALDMIGKLMQAPSRQKALDILHSADTTARRVYGLPVQQGKPPTPDEIMANIKRREGVETPPVPGRPPASSASPPPLEQQPASAPIGSRDHPVPVTNPQDALRLPPGTYYQTPGVHGGIWQR